MSAPEPADTVPPVEAYFLLDEAVLKIVAGDHGDGNREALLGLDLVGRWNGGAQDGAHAELHVLMLPAVGANLAALFAQALTLVPAEAHGPAPPLPPATEEGRPT